MGQRVMIKIKIIKEGYGHSVGQVLELTEFEAGHLMGFKYAIPYVEPKIETRPAVQPEVRILVPPIPIIVHEHEVEAKKEPEKPAGFFGKRGRRKKI